MNCPNRMQHVSAWPAFDRKLCPVCGRVYVRMAYRWRWISDGKETK